jgi:UDP-N-acetylglucosamine diphosphorylase / glucose-1-phosphate thymidylyltransferase / UDP-N-acetylgalactosamine diphosphorylase / glucosamine-1-phosphate N-acetyltransferase / galactosamine-1-phosphate N-acetyltransferase
MLLKPTEFFDLHNTSATEIIRAFDNVVDVIREIPSIISKLNGGARRIDGHVMDGAYLDEGALHIERGAIVEAGAYIMGPAYIGPGVVVGHGACIRGNVIMLAGSSLGHSSEATNSLFFERARAPHFAYVGHSILGQRVNLGAGVRLSNFPVTRDPLHPLAGPTIKLQVDGQQYDTGLMKLGAVLGDGVQIGCNCVLNPGTFIRPRTLVYAMVNVRSGFYPANAIIKSRCEIELTLRKIQ